MPASAQAQLVTIIWASARRRRRGCARVRARRAGCGCGTGSRRAGGTRSGCSTHPQRRDRLNAAAGYRDAEDLAGLQLPPAAVDQLDPVSVCVLVDVELNRDHAQAGYAAEIALVARDDAETVREGGGADPQIVLAEHLPLFGERRPQLRVNARHGRRDRHGLCTSEQRLHPRAPASADGARRSVNSVHQLADRDHAQPPLFLTDDFVEGPGAAPLRLDEYVGVDQDAQGSSGGPTSRRIRRRSSANASSTGGSDASSVRSRLAGSSRTCGGASTATGAPFRTISISSPAAARLRTSEKFRAASVAVSRATTEAYQRNQITGRPNHRAICRYGRSIPRGSHPGRGRSRAASRPRGRCRAGARARCPAPRAAPASRRCRPP
jgi:hypothetical protein